jgi:hypothetical protein
MKVIKQQQKMKTKKFTSECNKLVVVADPQSVLAIISKTNSNYF